MPDIATMGFDVQPEKKINILASPMSKAELASMLTGAQIRAARALLRWTGHDLASRSGVSYAAIQRAETVDDMPNMQTRNLAAIKSALEAGGVEFIEETGVRKRPDLKQPD